MIKWCEVARSIWIQIISAFWKFLDVFCNSVGVIRNRDTALSFSIRTIEHKCKTPRFTFPLT